MGMWATKKGALLPLPPLVKEVPPRHERNERKYASIEKVQQASGEKSSPLRRPTQNVATPRGRQEQSPCPTRNRRTYYKPRANDVRPYTDSPKMQQPTVCRVRRPRRTAVLAHAPYYPRGTCATPFLSTALYYPRDVRNAAALCCVSSYDYLVRAAQSKSFKLCAAR